MVYKEIEKQNFVLWYGHYATETDIKMAQSRNKETLDRLLKEYVEEVDRIDRSKRLYERFLQSSSERTQGFDGTLKIDSFSHLRENNTFK